MPFSPISRPQCSHSGTAEGLADVVHRQSEEVELLIERFQQREDDLREIVRDLSHRERFFDFELIPLAIAVISHRERDPFINRTKSSSAETVPTRPEEDLKFLIRSKERTKPTRVLQALGH